MAGQPSPEFERQLQKVRRPLERWRQARQGRRIPEEIWKKAVSVAARHGVAPVATALGLDYYSLKGRVSKQGASPGVALVPSEQVAAEFFELLPAPPGAHGLGRCTVEVGSVGGARMRVELEHLDISGLVNLVRDFAS